MKAARGASASILAILVSAALPGSAGASGAGAAVPEPTGPTVEASPAAPGRSVRNLLPPYLRGIDLNQPAQVAFAAWPSKDLVERSYWLPWAGLSFDRAGVFDQPIFLMLTVPWNRPAQRMLQGTLSDPDVLLFLNENYVTIAVRADRRPDIHARYGSGSWPAMSLLLPDGSPMLSQANAQGVALPIRLGYSDKPAFLTDLSEGRKYFDKWESFLHSLVDVYEKRVDIEDAKPGTIGPGTCEPIVKWMLGNFDARDGGFGAAPKVYPGGLMEFAAEREDIALPSLDVPARATLTKWVAGPLHDPVDGGFHRMAAAPEWGAIQFEKTLEVQTDLLRDLAFALREHDDPALRDALNGTARFVTTTLARPGGGFYNAQEPDPATSDGGAYWRSSPRDPSKAPAIDHFVLAGQNALAGAALLRASAVTGDLAQDRAGRAALDVVLALAYQPGRGVGHVIEAEPEGGRYLVTQADTAFALEDAYESTGDARYLAAAKDIVTFVRNNMRSADETNYRDRMVTGREFGLLDMPYRPVSDNARLARVLVRLEIQGAIDDGRKAAGAILDNYVGDLTLYGPRAVEAALAVHETLQSPLIVTIEGRADDPATQALRRAALAVPLGWVVVKTQNAAAPGAVLSRRGTSRRAASAETLPGELKKLLEATAGTP
jgi:uncharacterized protein